MSRTLTEHQELLAGYLVEIGCKMHTVWRVVAMDCLDPRAVLEMLQFCKENHPPTEAELLEMSSSLSLKYPVKDEEE